MSRRKAVLGIAVLCVAAFSAISAASASAGVTAFTCVKSGSVFNNPHCVPGGSGPFEYSHASFANGTTTHLIVAATGPQVLKSSLAGVEVETETSEVDAVTSGSTIENKLTGGVMHVGGTLELTYTNVVVKKPSACHVVGNMVTTKPLTFHDSGTGTNVKLEPAAGAVFAEIELAGCSIAATYPVEGTVEATTSGSTLSTSPATEALTIGGEEMTLTGTLTTSSTDTSIPTVTNPLALTSGV